MGADQFVIDSYQIQRGKFAILEMEGSCFAPLNPALLEEFPDQIAEGDLLKVALYHPERGDLASQVRTIGESVGYHVTEGKVHLPDLGFIEVEGLELPEARARIQQAYDRELNGVEVFLSFGGRMESRVELVGMVFKPTLPVDGKVRLFEVLAEARIPPNANLFKSYLVREGALLPVDINRLVKEGDMSQNVVMRGGDKLYIADPSRSTLMVMGEVRQERVIELQEGFLPLRTALAMAGGIPYTGNKGVIQVIRGNILCPKVYQLSWKQVVALPTSSMLLIPGDIVYVAATPITEWNRFISQIFPTLTGIELFRKGTAGVIASP